MSSSKNVATCPTQKALAGRQRVNVSKFRKMLLYTLHVTLYTVLLCGCSQPPYKETRMMMGTFVEITIRADGTKAREAAGKAFDRIAGIEKTLSVFDPGSEASVLNRTGTIKDPSPEFMEVMKEAVKAGDATEGAFDVTVAPVVSLWGFGPVSNVAQGFSPANGRHALPSEKQIKKALELVGYKNIIIDEKNNLIYFRKKGVQVNLGGIAKGFAVGKAAEVLKKEGIRKAIVKAGGDLYAMGTAWRIGIKNPRKEGILKTLTVKDRTVTTSGDYERFFMGFQEGKQKRFHHIFDPRTGYPAEGVISATVIAEDSMAADWLSTSMFVLGPEKGLALLKKMKARGVIITSDEQILATE